MASINYVWPQAREEGVGSGQRTCGGGVAPMDLETQVLAPAAKKIFDSLVMGTD